MTTATLELSCNYIDTCYPDYLTDHHWREGETLVSADIWEGMTVDDLVAELWDSLNSGANDIFAKFSEQEIKESIRYEFSDYFSRDFGLILSNFGIEKDEDEDEDTEQPCLYAYLSW